MKRFDMSIALGIVLCFIVVTAWLIPSVIIRDILEYERIYGESYTSCLNVKHRTDCKEYAGWVSSSGFNRIMIICIDRYDKMARINRPTSVDTCLSLYNKTYDDYTFIYEYLCVSLDRIC